MPLYLDLATRVLRLCHEGRTITEMAVLLSRPEHEVREALAMLGVVKADEHMDELDERPPQKRS